MGPSPPKRNTKNKLIRQRTQKKEKHRKTEMQLRNTGVVFKLGLWGGITFFAEVGRILGQLTPSWDTDRM